MTRRDQREETRRRVLDVARRHFEARGFEATQLRDVAKEAEVALGTIFVHFADKRDLVGAALYDELAVAVDRAVAAASSDAADGFVGALDAVTDEIVRHYEARPTLSRVLLRETLLAEPPWRERFAALLGRVGDAVAARAEAEKAAGRLSPSADVRVLSAAYVAFVQLGLTLWVQQSAPDPRRLVAALVRQHQRGVLP